MYMCNFKFITDFIVYNRASLQDHPKEKYKSACTLNLFGNYETRHYKQDDPIPKFDCNMLLFSNA